MTRSTSRPVRAIRAVALAASAALALSVAATGAADAAAAHSSGASGRATAASYGMAPRAAAHSSAGTADGGYPISSRSSVLHRASGFTASGTSGQQFRSVSMVQDVHRQALSANIYLAAAPATNQTLRLGFGVTGTENGAPVCEPNSGAYVDTNSFDVNGHGANGNPAYNGAHIVVKPFHFAASSRTGWNCSYALLITTNSDGSTTMTDAFTGGFVNHVAKPILAIQVPNKKLARHGFTKVKIKISNSNRTFATAYGTRLYATTHSLAVRVNKNVGAIKPGHSKVGHFFIEDTGRNGGSVKLTVVSGSYRHSITLHVHTEAR